MRNRYSNIFPWGSNRVRLDVPKGRCDYINASPIALKSHKDGSVKRYIATQVCVRLFPEGERDGRYTPLRAMLCSALAILHCRPIRSAVGRHR